MGGGPADGTGATGPAWASLFDPIANARAFGDIQAQALRAAGDLVDRLARSTDGAPADAAASADGEPAPDGATPPLGDAARLLEVWIDLLQRASKSFAGARGDATDDTRRVDLDLATDSPTGLLRIELDVSGAIGNGAPEAWLHNGTTTAVGPLTLVGGELRAPDGELLAATVECEPAHLDALPGRSSRGVAVTVAKDGELRPGVYRGLIQVDGAPQIWLTVEVAVIGPAPAS